MTLFRSPRAYCLLLGSLVLLLGLSWLTQRDQRPTFALWGIRTSAAAQAQVAAYSFAEQPAFFYANNRTNEYSPSHRV